MFGEFRLKMMVLVLRQRDRDTNQRHDLNFHQLTPADAVFDVGGAVAGVDNNLLQIWKQYGFLPEFYNVAQGGAANKREGYPLRPELIESVMYLYRATKDPYLLTVGEDMLQSIQVSEP